MWESLRDLGSVDVPFADDHKTHFSETTRCTRPSPKMRKPRIGQIHCGRTRNRAHPFLRSVCGFYILGRGSQMSFLVRSVLA